MLSWPLCDLNFSVPLSSFFETFRVGSLFYMPARVRWKASCAISRSWSGSKAVIRKHSISFSVFFKYSVYLRVCVQNACFRGTCKFVWADVLRWPESPRASVWHQTACSVLGEGSSPVSCAPMDHGSPCTHRKTVGHSWRFTFSSRLDSGGSCERKWGAAGQEARFGQLGFGGLRGTCGGVRGGLGLTG